ncbi:MAG: PAS domain S-box protein [Promethearchaeota archaeon]
MPAKIKQLANKLEQDLKESEEKFRLITDQPIIGVGILQDNVIKYVNEGASNINEYSVQEMQNWTINDIAGIIHPADSHFALEQAKKKQVGKHDVVFNYEYRIITKSGEVKWIDQYSKTIFFEGKPADLSLWIDITERKKAEIEIQNAQVELNTIFNAAGNGMRVIDDNFNVIRFNQAFAELTGANIKELEGFKCYNQFPHPECHTQECTLRRILDGEEFIDIEVIKERKDGSKVTCMLVATPYQNANGEIVGAIEVFKDITEHKQTEKKLKESTDKFKTLFMYNPVPTYVWKKIENDLILVDYNEAAYKITDGGVKAYLESKATNLYRNNPDILDDLNRCLNEGVLISKEMNYKFHSAPKEKILDVTYAFIPPDLVLVHTKDITKHKKTEELLLNNEKFLSNVFSSIQDGICIIDKNFNIIRINPTMERWYPHMKPILGKKCYQVYQHRTEPCEDCLCAKIYETYEPIVKTIFRKGNEKEILGILEVYTFPLFDQESGAVNGVIEYLRDVTEYKLAEQKLKESEEKYRSILENINEGYFETDLRGDFSFCNNAFFNIIKFPKEEIMGNNYSYFINEEDLDNVYQMFNTVYRTENPQISIKYRIKSLIGEPRFVETSAYLRFDSKGNKIGFYGLIRDITEKTNAERMIKQEINKLKEIDQIKTDFIDRISHELRTPLVSISSASQLLLESCRDKIDKKSESLIKIINDGGRRLEFLIENLLDVSRIESNELKLIIKRENIVKIILECIAELKFMADQRNLKIINSLYNEYFIEIDSLRIRQVLMNIIMNAINNTPPFGLISVNLKKQENFIDIKITDTGVGFTKQEMSKIFKKFGKIERYGKGMDLITEGSGLGLYISKEIIDAHNGAIWVESNGRNKGAVFTIRLPVKNLESKNYKTN